MSAAPPLFWQAPPPFWQAPPWPPSPKNSGYRLGASRLGEDKWLPDQITPEARARKIGLLNMASLPHLVFAALPATEAAQRLALQQVRHRPLAEGCADFGADIEDSTSNPPLTQAALLVPQDLCLLRLDQRQSVYRLIAGVVCSPSYWRLEEKLGATLGEIHSPVPQLNSELGGRIDHFMQQLPADGIFQRQNFFLHAQRDLYQPEPDRVSYDLANADQWVIRTERQQFRRLAPDLLLFSIGVSIVPWLQIRQYPEAQLSLRLHLGTFNDAQIENFGGRTKWQMLCDLLDAWHLSNRST